MSPSSSMRSRRRVTSGTLRTSRSPTSFRHNPPGPAPRRIRRTLYCVDVIEKRLRTWLAVCSSTADVRAMFRMASSSRPLQGFVCFSSCCSFDVTLRVYVFKHPSSTPHQKPPFPGAAALNRLTDRDAPRIFSGFTSPQAAGSRRSLVQRVRQRLRISNEIEAS